MTPTSNALNPRIQAVIALLLLLILGGVVFLPGLVKGFTVDADTKQFVFTATAIAVTFYLGSSSSSAKKDEQAAALTAQLMPSAPVVPTAPAAPVKIDDSTPIKTQEVKP